MAIVIETDDQGDNPRIIGQSNPDTELKTFLDYRDAFLAAAHIHEASIIYKPEGRNKEDYRRISRKDPRDLLGQFMADELAYYDNYSEKMVAHSAMLLKERMKTDTKFKQEINEQIAYRRPAENRTVNVFMTQEVDHSETRSVYKYKPVDLKVKPTLAELPSQYRILRQLKGDPLEGMPELSRNPGDFVPTGRYTAERRAILEKQRSPEFLTEEEVKLRDDLMMKQNEAFAWCDEEKGRFDTEMFPPVKMPVVEHTPWVEKNIPIPPGIFDEVCKIIKQKIASGTYEPSNSSYRSRWFCVIKKDGKSLRLVHSLEPLNLVTIAHSGVPPGTEAIADQFAGRACGSTFDLYVGYDERLLDEGSRDYTTFQTPFGALRLTTLPMGWTNSVPIFHDDVTFILKDEIPQVTLPYIDDVPVKGPLTRYEEYDEEGKVIGYETIEGNPGIRRFVWEHFQDINRVIQRIKHAGGTMSGKKSYICEPSIVVVGHRCTYEGRIPDQIKVVAITNWPPCKNTTDIRSFLGTAGVCRMFVKNYASIATPLNELLQKNRIFVWGDKQQEAMDAIKEAIVNSPALKPLNYSWNTPVVLAVDTSHIAIGFYIYQIDPDTGKKHFARFSSIPLEEHERNYSQPKRELFGLKRALTACRYWLIGCRNLKVEIDATYIKGMLEHPDQGPNATINRWIEEILRYHFTLIHIPGHMHGPDGLSRRTYNPGDPDYPVDDSNYEIEDEGLKGVEYPYGNKGLPAEFEEFKTEIDTRGGYYQAEAESILDFWKHECIEAQELDAQYRRAFTARVKEDMAKNPEISPLAVFMAEETFLPSENERNDPVEQAIYPDFTEEEQRVEDKVQLTRQWLESGKSDILLANMTKPERTKFIKFALRFSLNREGRFYKIEEGRYKLYVEPKDRMFMLKAGHDSLGHRGVFATTTMLNERFWWPRLEKDCEWFVATCHKCQLRLTRLKVKPPTITYTPSLFEICHADTMEMTGKCGPYKYLIHARDGLSSWPEMRATTAQNGPICAEFLLEEVICRWGVCRTIITDNAPLWTNAVKCLTEKYGIRNITISGYNSKANGKVERAHFDTREVILKGCGYQNLNKWRHFVPYAAWSERVTIRRRFGCSPYFIVTGTEPIMPLDILEATYLVAPPDRFLTTEELVAQRAITLMKHNRHVEDIRSKVHQHKIDWLLAYERKHIGGFIKEEYGPGDLILIRNSKVESRHDRKPEPRYNGPMVVLRKKKGGAYLAAELNGATIGLPVAEYRVLRYRPRKALELPDNIHRLIDASAEDLDRIEATNARWDEPLGDDLINGKIRWRLPDEERQEDEEESEEEIIPEEEDEDYLNSDEPIIKTRRQAEAIKRAKAASQQNMQEYAQQLFLDSLIPRPWADNEWKLGVHVSTAINMEETVLEAGRVGANAFAMFLKPEKGWGIPELSIGTIERFKSYMNLYKFDPRHILPHGGYLINLAHTNTKYRYKSQLNVLDDLSRCEKLGIPLYNLHPGIVNEGTRADAIKRIAASLNSIHYNTPESKITILLETMPGGGKIIGGDFQEIADIIDLVKNKDRIGITLDTCHSFTAGYDIRKKEGWDQMILSLDKIIGLKYLRAIHMNDSQHEFESQKDRHHHLGFGFIGLEPFKSIVTDEQFKNIPIILETPRYADDEVRKQELTIWNKYSNDKNEEQLKDAIRELRRLVTVKARELAEVRLAKQKANIARQQKRKQQQNSKLVFNPTSSTSIFTITRENAVEIEPTVIM